MKMEGNIWILGCSFQILSTFSGTVGKLLLRYGSIVEQRPGQFKRGRRLGLAGLMLNATVSPTLDMISYTFAPQTIIAPFAGLDVAWNVLLAPYVLGETLNKMKLGAIAMVFAGVTSTLFFVDTNEPVYDAEYAKKIVYSWRTLFYTAAVLTFVTVNITFQRRQSKGDNRRGLSLGVTGGALAGNMFCVKLVGEFIQTSFNDEGFKSLGNLIEKEWELFFLTVFGAAFFALSNIWFVATGMREFEALFMVTIFEGTMIISGCISGTVVLREFDGSDWFKPIGYFCCVLSIVGGIYILFIAQMRAASSLFARTASIAPNKAVLQKTLARGPLLPSEPDTTAHVRRAQTHQFGDSSATGFNPILSTYSGPPPHSKITKSNAEGTIIVTETGVDQNIVRELVVPNRSVVSSPSALIARDDDGKIVRPQINQVESTTSSSQQNLVSIKTKSARAPQQHVQNEKENQAGDETLNLAEINIDLESGDKINHNMQIKHEENNPQVLGKTKTSQNISNHQTAESSSEENHRVPDEAVMSSGEQLIVPSSSGSTQQKNKNSTSPARSLPQTHIEGPQLEKIEQSARNNDAIAQMYIIPASSR